MVLSPGDTVIVAATRAALANALARRQPLMEADSDTSNSGRETQAPAGTISLAEVVVAPRPA